jgi:hypothetical protein
VSIVQMSGVAGASTQDAVRPQDWRDNELNDWVKTSASTVRDFSRTMISLSIGAVPIYFATTQFLGKQRVHGGWAALALAPPVLFLLAAIAFGAALRPALITVTSLAGFAQWRRARLAAMNRWVQVAMALFLAGASAAGVVWAILLLDEGAGL